MIVEKDLIDRKFRFLWRKKQNQDYMIFYNLAIKQLQKDSLVSDHHHPRNYKIDYFNECNNICCTDLRMLDFKLHC